MKAKHKILMMIDDRRLLGSVRRELEGLHCELTESRQTAVQTVFDQVPHLIIIDENFGQGKGRRVALDIKEDLVLQYIPVVLLADRKQVARSKEGEKIDSFFQKDKLSAALSPTVRELLSRNHNELDLNPLTYLPGTCSSVLRIEEAIRLKKHFAVCCVDLTALAAFNSAYGDARGDEIIVQLGKIAQEVLKYHGSTDDFLGHLGGDDLIIVTRSDLADLIAEVIIQNFDSVITRFYDPHDREQGYIVQRNEDGMLAQYPIMSVSIAIVHNEFIPITEMSEISRIAGRLKKYIKKVPGSCYIKFRQKPSNTHDFDNEALEVRYPSKMKSVTIHGSGEGPDRYVTFFNTILKEKKIRTLYQPIADLKTKKVIGYEALTRALSGYPPDDASVLFAVAREAGRVKELDRLCVEFALKNGQGLPPDEKLFLNLNHETLIDPKLMKELFAQKGTIGFKNIVIEVTEQSLLRSFDRVRDALLELREQGVAVAIDDVGGGAVSLRDVAVLKPEYIKFDRSLVRQIDISTTKQQIALSMILFAKSIHAITTAEGIETKEEYEAVLMCGIELGQGYYLARPGPAFPKLVFGG